MNKSPSQLKEVAQPVFVRDTVGEETACVGGGETGERVLHLAVVAEADHRDLRSGWQVIPDKARK